jgi:fructuronate reductase
VHLGLGAFHRAHQAVYTDDAMTAGDRDWAITGVSMRSPRVQEALAPQDGLYTVAERHSAGERVAIVGAIRELILAPHAPDMVMEALAAPSTRVVTITVTEKGYHRGADGTLDIAALERLDGTIYHHLARAFGERRARGLPGLTIVPCDNLADNGRVLDQAIAAYLDRFAPGVRRWFTAECACPSTMVDRIVPAVADADLDRMEATLGLRDEAAIVTEPFRQWVIEDRFAGARPRWEAGGAQFVADARPYETAKLRMLNGAHSALAYLGLSARYDFVHEAIADCAIRPVVERLMRQEAAASVDPAPNQNLDGYADTLFARFTNAALPHRLAQIAADGSQKIGPRWLEPLAINRARGLNSPATLEALAAWVLHVRGIARPVDDPLADRLRALWLSAGSDGIVEALFGSAGLFRAAWQATAADLVAVSEMVKSGSAGSARG